MTEAAKEASHQKPSQMQVYSVDVYICQFEITA